MKISVITVVYNNEKQIAQAIESVLGQSYKHVEYIVVDGASKDKTMEVVNRYKEKIQTIISEPDKGLYDAMNKGVQHATGDVVGILNSDDFFYDENVLSKIAAAFDSPAVDAVFADIVFINDDNSNKVIRKYTAKKWKPGKFAWGYMPPHPSFFVRREFFEKLGNYKLNYKIAADYELLIRFLLVNKLRYKYLPMITTKMRMGGNSTKNLHSTITLNKEILQACRENGIYSNYLMIYSKYFFKPFEFLSHE